MLNTASSVHNLTATKIVVVGLFSALIVVGGILLLALSVLFTSVVMRFLQNIIQSVNTSIQLLRHTVHRLNIDVILLQEIWQPSDGSITIKNYSQPITKFRQGGKGGGVAIIPHRKVKIVHLKEYDMDGLEAVWAVILINKVQTVIGSVYVPPGDMSALSILDTVISKILTSFSHILIAINANSRSTLWDDMCAGISQSRRLSLIHI